MTTTTKPRGIARGRSVCSNRNCTGIIYPGHLIRQNPSGGWQHLNCSTKPWDKIGRHNRRQQD